jgi:HPt (histidine-containing phosphotransfer) domain-containing protein
LKGAAGGMGAVQLVHYATRLEKATYENMRARELSWTEELRRLAAEAITTLEGCLEDRRNQRPEA